MKAIDAKAFRNTCPEPPPKDRQVQTHVHRHPAGAPTEPQSQPRRSLPTHPRGVPTKTPQQTSPEDVQRHGHQQSLNRHFLRHSLRRLPPHAPETPAMTNLKHRPRIIDVSKDTPMKTSPQNKFSEHSLWKTSPQVPSKGAPSSTKTAAKTFLKKPARHTPQDRNRRIWSESRPAAHTPGDVRLEREVQAIGAQEIEALKLVKAPCPLAEASQAALTT